VGGAVSYEQMTNLPRELRDALAAEVPLSSLRLLSEARSSDGTQKALFETADGRPVNHAVFMGWASRL
jgi:23S rRNA (adenine2503-C2)-methyltransferase